MESCGTPEEEEQELAVEQEAICRVDQKRRLIYPIIFLYRHHSLQGY